jgi:chromosome segregation ATPase
MQNQTDITELERRITQAMERIGRSLPRLPATEAGPDLGAEVAKLREALAAEKARGAELAEKLRSLKDREPMSSAQVEAKIERMTRQLDVQGLELQRMRKTTIQLREQLRTLHQAASAGLVEPQMVNKAMLAELDALRATRHTEVAEMDEILAELGPLIEEVRAHG